ENELAVPVAVRSFSPRVPAAVHLPVELEEERMSPGFGGLGPLPDVGVVLALDQALQGEVGLVRLEWSRARSPAEERDRAVSADVLEPAHGKAVERADAGMAGRERRGEVDERQALSGEHLEAPGRPHVPGSLEPGEVSPDPGSPEDPTAWSRRRR